MEVFDTTTSRLSPDSRSWKKPEHVTKTTQDLIYVAGIRLEHLQEKVQPCQKCTEHNKKKRKALIREQIRNRINQKNPQKSKRGNVLFQVIQITGK